MPRTTRHFRTPPPVVPPRPLEDEPPAGPDPDDTLDDTIAASFPASDPPSSIPDPDPTATADEEDEPGS